MLLLNIYRKLYIGNPIIPSYLTLSDLERSKSMSLRIWLVGDLYGVVYSYGLLLYTRLI